MNKKTRMVAIVLVVIMILSLLTSLVAPFVG